MNKAELYPLKYKVASIPWSSWEEHITVDSLGWVSIVEVSLETVLAQPQFLSSNCLSILPVDQRVVQQDNVLPLKHNKL